MKKNKIMISAILILIIIIFTFAGIWIFPVHGEKSTEHWNSKMKYSDDYAINIEKDAIRTLRFWQFQICS